MNASDDLRPDIDCARSVSRRLRQIFDAGGGAIVTLEDALRLCEAGWASVDDPYCRSVLRAIGVCAECSFAGDPDSPSLAPLIRSLLTALDRRLLELESGCADDVRSSRDADRRRAQRRNYLLRPAANAVRQPRYRAASLRDE